MKKRIFSRVLALVMAVSLLSTTAFAASFTDLQEAIDGANDNKEATETVDSAGTADAMPEVTEPEAPEAPVPSDTPTEPADTIHVNGALVRTDDEGVNYFGYGWNSVTEGEETKWYYAIEAWDAETGERCVVLFEDVEFDKSTDTETTFHKDKTDGNYYAGIVVEGDDKSVNLELNGYELNLNPDTVFTVDEKMNPSVKDKDGNELLIVTPDNYSIDLQAKEGLNHGSVIVVKNGGRLTVTDSSRSQTGTITGGMSYMKGHANWKFQGGGVSIYNGGSFTMKGGNITGNISNEHGAGISGNLGAECRIDLDGVSVSRNFSTGNGGGIHTRGITTIKNSKIIGNWARLYGGGGIYITGGKLAVDNSLIQGNFSTGAGGIYAVYTCEQETILDHVVITDNTGYETGGINVPGAKISYSLIAGNHSQSGWGAGGGNSTATYDHSVVCNNTKLSNRTESNLSDGTSVHDTMTFEEFEALEAYLNDGDWVKSEETENIPATYEQAGRIVTEYRCAKCNELICERIVEIPMLQPDDPVIPDNIFTDITGNDATDEGTTIEDEETPLAGLFTRADAIGYLWEQTGSPEAELSDFADVPEDHYWAVAIGWAQDMGIALPDEDGNFRPDDLVLRTSDEPEGELQEFLNRYAVFAGVELEDGELFIELDGAAEDFIMGEEAQVIFDEFFAKLEVALAAQAA